MTRTSRARNGTGSGLANRTARSVAIALALYAVAVPLTLSLLLETLTSPPARPLATLWLGMAILGPAAAVVAGALRGPLRIVQELAEREDGEPQQILIRLFFPGVVLAYLAGLAALRLGGDHLLPLTAIVIAGVLCEWLLFVDLICRLGPSPLRRGVAMLSDIAFISTFLYVGGALAAPWFSIYLWVALGFGFRFGERTLIAAAALSLAGFAAVWAESPYWQAAPMMAAGVMLALTAVPGYVVVLLRPLRRARAQTESASVAKSRLLAVMDHEFRTPLNSIIGMTTLFGRTELEPAQRDMLATIQLAARMLLGLSHGMLDAARAPTGRPPAAAESFMLHQVLNAAVAILKPQAKAKGLTLALMIDPRLPHAYRGLALPLRQILLNLVANAIAFTREGRVAVSARLAGREGQTVHLRLAVRDEGAGIAPELRDTLFDAAIDSESALARRFGSTGLGLAITKELTRMMGGSLAVESEPGKGSTFLVDLPLQLDAAAASRPPDLAGREAIIVTADTGLAETLQAKLAAWHGAPRWIAEGEAAVQQIGEATAGGPRGLLLIDGRSDPLAALSLAHRLASAAAEPPLTLFLAARGDGESVAGLGAAELAAIIEVPLEEGALASALLAVADTGASEPPAETSAPADATASAAPLREPARKLRILVADSNAANGKVIRRVLELAGHQAMVVQDGEAALAVLDRERFDLALLDTGMAEMSGFDVARLYRMEHLGEGRLPIIGLAPEAADETERQCREAGMDAVLAKPLEAAELLAAVDETYARVTGGNAAAAASPVVTPISAHPRYFADAGAVVDEATIEALRLLGGNSDFLGDIIETFCAEAWRSVELMRLAAAEGDLSGFKELGHSLRSGAANVGAARLCQTLASLRDITARELRQNGGAYVEKLQAEFAKVETTLSRMIPEARLG
jgi:two-component system sensor histidine kinase RpfC